MYRTLKTIMTSAKEFRNSLNNKDTLASVNLMTAAKLEF